MSLKNVNTGDGLHFKGMVTLDIERGEEKKSSSYTNTITPAGKQFLASQACGSLFGCSPISYGSFASTHAMFGTVNQYVYSPTANNIVGSDKTSMGVVLLNLDASTLAGLSTSTNYIPVLNSTMEGLGSQVVGYASVNTTPEANGLEGSIDYQKPSYISNSNAQCGRWVFPEGVGTGTVNCIALMPMSALQYNLGTTFRNWKYLDKVNPRYTNFGRYSTGYLIPGVEGYTTDEEILLNYSQDGITKHKYNFVTGVMTDYPDSDSTPFWVADCNTSLDTYLGYSQYVYNGFLYVLCRNSFSSSTVYIKVFDISNGMALKTTFSFNTDVSSICFFLEYGGSLYVSCLHSSYSSSRCLAKLNIGSGGYATSATTYNNYSTLGFNYSPDVLSVSDYCFASYGGNYLLVLRSSSKSIKSSSDITFGCVAYVFTDPTDVVGSIIGCLGSLPHQYAGTTSSFSLFSNSAGSGIIQQGMSFGEMESSSLNYSAACPYTVSNDGGYTYDTSNRFTSLDSTYLMNYGSTNQTSKGGSISLSLDSWGANVLSYVVLPEPITIGANDVLRVSYGYAIQ